MATGHDWSRQEVEACVADYLQMLMLELNGQRYNKTEHAKALSRVLDGRSRPAIEFKHCNISSILTELGYPSINGYKPRGNYQALLADVVETQASSNRALQEAALSAVLRPAIAASVADPSMVWVATPSPSLQVSQERQRYTVPHAAVKRDYLAQEARNRSLGRAGEIFVVELEQRRLHAEGKRALSNRVQHVAATQGDGLGFDVLSFDNDGRERLIEVKTTAFGELTPFFVSRNELTRSERDADCYHLYRLFDFRKKPRAFDLPGAISGQCQLDPVTYLARLHDR